MSLSVSDSLISSDGLKRKKVDLNSKPEGYKIVFCPGGVSLKYHNKLELGNDLSAAHISNVISQMKSSKKHENAKNVVLILSDQGIEIHDTFFNKCYVRLLFRSISFVICATKEKKIAIISNATNKEKLRLHFAYILSTSKEEETVLLNETLHGIFNNNGNKQTAATHSDHHLTLNNSKGSYVLNSSVSDLDASLTNSSCSLKKYMDEHSKMLGMNGKNKPENQHDIENTTKTFIYVPMNTANQSPVSSKNQFKHNESYINDSGVCGSFCTSITTPQEKIFVDPLTDFISWNHPEFSRKDAERHMRTRGVGCFVIRRSATWKGCLVMSVLQCEEHGTVAHYLIKRDLDGRLFFDGHQETWNSIESLVANLQMPLLRLFRSNI